MDQLGVKVPGATVKTLESPQNAQMVTRARRFRVTLYVYAELLKQGRGGRRVKHLVRLGRCSKTSSDVAHQDRARDRATEAAADLAASAMYKMLEEGTAFSRVIISDQASAGKAKRNAIFEYSLSK